jgi:hypothetical protein
MKLRHWTDNVGQWFFHVEGETGTFIVTNSQEVTKGKTVPFAWRTGIKFGKMGKPVKIPSKLYQQFVTEWLKANQEKTR